MPLTEQQILDNLPSVRVRSPSPDDVRRYALPREPLETSALAPEVFPYQSCEGNHAGNDRPRCDPGDKNKEKKLCHIIAWCFVSKEFSAQFAEGFQLERGRRFFRAAAAA